MSTRPTISGFALDAAALGLGRQDPDRKNRDFSKRPVWSPEKNRWLVEIPRPPKGREEVPVQISRLLHAHEIVLREARTMARRAAEGGDDGTNDLIVSDVIRHNELQVWFVAEHVVDMPLVQAV